MGDRLHIEFAAVELLREVFDRRKDWTWMSFRAVGAIGYSKGISHWMIHYDIAETKCHITIIPSDDPKYMLIRNKEQDFDLVEPKVFDIIEKFIDDYIEETIC